MSFQILIVRSASSTLISKEVNRLSVLYLKFGNLLEFPTGLHQKAK